MIIRTALILLLFSTSVAAAFGQDQPPRGVAGPPSDWMKFVSYEGRFSVQMPGKPVDDSSRNLLAEGNSKPHTFFLTTTDRQYMVSYMDYTNPINGPEDRSRILNSACKKLDDGKARLTATKDISLAGDPGIECTLDLPDGVEVTRLFLSSQRLFLLMTITTGSKTLSQDSIKFLDSFSIYSGVGFGPGISGDHSDGGDVNLQKMQILNSPRPDYTQNAREHSIEGVVIVQALFKADGTITDMKVLRGLGYGLDEEAMKAVGKIKFSPAMRDGKKIDQKHIVRISFTLLKRRP